MLACGARGCASAHRPCTCSTTTTRHHVGAAPLSRIERDRSLARSLACGPRSLYALLIAPCSCLFPLPIRHRRCGCPGARAVERKHTQGKGPPLRNFWNVQHPKRRYRAVILLCSAQPTNTSGAGQNERRSSRKEHACTTLLLLNPAYASEQTTRKNYGHPGSWLVARGSCCMLPTAHVWACCHGLASGRTFGSLNIGTLLVVVAVNKSSHRSSRPAAAAPPPPSAASPASSSPSPAAQADDVSVIAGPSHPR